MEELTGSAIVLLLTLVTPAIPLFLFFRLRFLKIRTVIQSDLLLIVIGCLLSLLINWKLIGYMADAVVPAITSTPKTEEWSDLVKLLLPSGADFKPFRPAYEFLSRYCWPGLSRTNVVIFLLDLHARTVLVGAAFWASTGAAAGATEYLQYLSYSNNAFKRFIAAIFGYDFAPDQSRYMLEHQSVSLIDKFIRYFRAAIYHPWMILTFSNPLREILLVDVLTKEGSLYSGVLINWIPDGHQISAIAMRYALRYATKKPSPPQPPGTIVQPSIRVKELIKNNGKLIIPAEQILTIHLWELRRHVQCVIPVRSLQDTDVVKWYYLIAFLYPDFIDKITVQLFLPPNEVGVFGKRLTSWLVDNRLESLPSNLAEFLPAAPQP